MNELNLSILRIHESTYQHFYVKISRQRKVDLFSFPNQIINYFTMEVLPEKYDILRVVEKYAQNRFLLTITRLCTSHASPK